MLAAIPAALDGRELTREELAVEVARVTGIDGLDGKLRGGFGDLLKPAAFRGDLCFAPSDGRNVRFARPDQWLGEWEAVEQDEAVREVTRRYLAAYGPANRETLARWFGMSSPAAAGRWLARLGDEAADGRARRRGAGDARRRRRGRGERRAGRRRSASCPRSTTTSSPPRATATPCCPPRSGRGSTARRAGCRRCCWSTAGWPASGRTSARASGWRGDRAVRQAQARREGGRRGRGAGARRVRRRRDEDAQLQGPLSRTVRPVALSAASVMR